MYYIQENKENKESKECPFKNIFGKPKEGAHKFRIFDIAIIDVIGTLLLAFLFYKLLKYTSINDFILIFLLLIILSIFIHKFFCVSTTLTDKIFS